MEKKKSRTMTEEWNRLRDWYDERDLSVGDVVRRMVAVAVAMVGGSMAFVGWMMVGELGSMVTSGGGLGYGIGALFVAGLALLATCGVMYLVWAIWTDNL